MSFPEPLIVGVVIHIATVIVGVKFVNQLKAGHGAAYVAAGSPEPSQVVWNKLPPRRYICFLLSRKFASCLGDSKLRWEGELLFVLYCAQLLCMFWFAVGAN